MEAQQSGNWQDKAAALQSRTALRNAAEEKRDELARRASAARAAHADRVALLFAEEQSRRLAEFEKLGDEKRAQIEAARASRHTDRHTAREVRRSLRKEEGRRFGRGYGSWGAGSGEGDEDGLGADDGLERKADTPDGSADREKGCEGR